MTEEEAAHKLCELLNEVEEAGHQVQWTHSFGADGLAVGLRFHIAEPPCEGEPWEVRES